MADLYFDSTDENRLRQNKITVLGHNGWLPHTYTKGETVTAIADEGYEFFYVDDDPTKPSIYLMDGQYRENFTLSENNTKATIVLGSWGSYYSAFEGETRLAAIEPEQKEVPTNNVYLIDFQKLRLINNERFVDGANGIKDYGQFIISTLLVPAIIDPELMGDDEDIKLLNLNTNVQGTSLNTDKLEIDLGSIVVPEPENLFEYSNTKLILHLPMVDSVVLDSEYVLGETISIKYVADLYTGSADVLISSSKVDSVINNFVANIGINVPYSSTVPAIANLDNSNISISGNNEVITPFIEVVRFNDPKFNSIFNAVVPDYGIIGNNKGFITVDNMDLQAAANGDEVSKIIYELSRGVIVK